MFSKKNSHLKGAALAFRADAALYAELRQDENGYALVNARRLELPPGLVEDDKIVDGDALGLYLSEKCRLSWNLPFALGIPSAECMAKVLTLNMFSLEEARQFLRWNLSEYFPYSSENAVFDVFECGASAEGLKVLALAVPKAQIMPLLARLHGFNRRLDIMEPQAIAAARALTGSAEDDDAILLVFGERRVSATFTTAGNVELFRSFDFLPDGTDRAGDLGTEVEQTMSLISRESGAQAPRVLVAGNVPWFCDRLPVFSNAESRTMTDVRRISFELPAQEDWYDVAGLLLRFADENGV